MPRHPEVSPHLGTVGRSVYSSLAGRARARGGPVYPLHIGDTWLDPAVGTRMQDLRTDAEPRLHNYAAPEGEPALRERIAALVAEQTGMPTSASEVLVAAGATGALAAVCGAVVAPGDEVLIVAPHWPLIAGIVRNVRGVAVQVDALDALDADDGAQAAARLVAQLTAACTERTVALYVNTPHNPTGRVFAPALLAALAAFARARDLWLIADEVYEHFAWGAPHQPMRPLAPERTLSLHSTSKAFGMAGNRCGWVVGPSDVLAAALKVATHTFYSTPTAAQRAALAALGPAGDAWLAAVRPQYEQLGRAAAARLGVRPPDGSTFLFVDVRPALDGRALADWLGGLADDGLLVAPGPSFGPYPGHIRLCFTCAEPDIVRAGVEVLARHLGR